LSQRSGSSPLRRNNSALRSLVVGLRRPFAGLDLVPEATALFGGRGIFILILLRLGPCLHPLAGCRFIILIIINGLLPLARGWLIVVLIIISDGALALGRAHIVIISIVTVAIIVSVRLILIVIT
jgi:hypothetical protein